MNRKITIIKALGIIAIVHGHLCIGNLIEFFYLYHIPLFFFITGYLYKEKYTENPLLMVKQRIKSLYIPFVLYSLSFLLLRNYFVKLGIYTPEFQIRSMNQYLDFLSAIFTFQYSEPLLMAFWFITCLFMVSIIFTLVRFICVKINPFYHKESTFYIVTILFLIGFFLIEQKTFLPLQLDKAFIATFFVYLGYLYKDNENRVILTGEYAFLALLALIVFGNYGRINMDLRQYSSPPFYLVCGLLGIYFTFWAGVKISKYQNNATKFLEVLGNHTFPILTLHLLAFKTITAIRINIETLNPSVLSDIFPGTIPNTDNFWRLIYTLGGVFLPVLLSLLIKVILNPLIITFYNLNKKHNA